MNTNLPAAPGHGRQVAVLGAYGHTGRFVVAELLRRGFAPIAIGRDAAKLAGMGWAEQGVAVRTASVDEPGALDRALAGAQALINCAGPFLDTADAAVRAALRAGLHYFDVTAEQASAQATLRDFDEPARAAGVFVMPAMAFYGGLGDLLATQAMGDWEAADAIDIAIALDRWWPTEGTRITGERNTFRRLVVTDGQLVPQSLPARETSWRFAEPVGQQDVVEVPFSEVVTITRHLHTNHLHTYLSQVALSDIRDGSTPPPSASDASGRSAQQFLMEAVVRRGDATRRVSARGRDIYAFTAPLVVEALLRVLDGQTPGHTSGAVAPGEVFDAAAFLKALVAEEWIAVASD